MHMIFCVDVRNGGCEVATVLPVRGVGLGECLRAQGVWLLVCAVGTLS